jgi:hypothetical protein
MKRAYVLLAASLTLAVSAAYYSVFGIGRLFSSQFLAVTILAGSLEASKLITASYLHRKWAELGLFIKSYLVVAVLVLMTITSLGIYGFLVSAYQETASKMDVLERRVELIAQKETQYQTQLDATRQDKRVLNSSVTQLTTALANNRIQYTDAQGNQVVQTSAGNRTAYQQQLQYANSQLQRISIKESELMDSVMSLQLQQVELQSNSDVAAEIGPLKYIAEITGKSMDVVVNWLIIMLILVFDPLAIMLLIVANKELSKPKETALEPVIDPNNTIEEQPQPEEPQVKAPEILSYWKKIRNERKK